MSHLTILKPKTVPERRTRTTVDTIMVTPERIAKWKLPSGQRPLRENAKLRMISEQIKQDGGVIPGVLTIGILSGAYWIIDGQHRLHAFSISGVTEGYADIRFVHAESMVDITDEFVRLNSDIVRMRPDDFLRGLEGSIFALQAIRKACPFVGYDQIRRGTSGPILSMSCVLRWWRGSGMETPSGSVSGMSAVDLAQSTTDEEVSGIIDFLHLANEAFGRDVQYAQLWTGLNMVLCMWMFRKLVLTQYSPKTPRIDRATFKKCLMSVSADSVYQDWLHGRHMGERDRSPAYARLKSIFGKRLQQELTGSKVQLPAPDWSAA